MNYTQAESNLITLCSFEELTYSQRSEILSGRSQPDFDKLAEILIKKGKDGVYNKVKAKFYSEAYRAKLFAKLEEKKIVCVTCFSENYPAELKNTPCPPHTLFCKGDTSLLKSRKFAVVGSRRTPPNILAECKRAVADLTDGFTVVTGTADGADTAVLESALASGKIISVLPSGFDKIYPASNVNLLEKVAKKGLIISEYTPQISATRYTFPVRNRIIAGLSDGVLVVSAPEGSGALITADYANDFGRSVYAFPYTLGTACGEGCNRLIHDGATLFRNTLDIFSDFGLDFKPREKRALTEDEELVYNLIRRTGEAFVDNIASEAGTEPFKIVPVLLRLEMKGLVVRLGGNRYSAM